MHAIDDSTGASTSSRSLSASRAVRAGFGSRACCAVAVLLLFSLVAGLGLARASGEQPAQQDAKREVKRQVVLMIDYGDGVEKHFTALEWKQGMTVLEALEAASRHPRGIKLEYRGSGATAFVERIDDLENQGAGGGNWTYQINGKRATQGAGASSLEPGARVLWKFGGLR